MSILYEVIIVEVLFAFDGLENLTEILQIHFSLKFLKPLITFFTRIWFKRSAKCVIKKIKKKFSKKEALKTNP